MGIKFSQLPIAASIAPDDYLAMLDSSESKLKRIPIDHSTTSAAYGLASTALYGHTKVIDGLSSTVYNEGEALSAHQGNVISSKLGNTDISDVGTSVTDAIHNLKSDGGAPDFIGTMNDWEALTSTEKAKYDQSKGVIVNLTNDNAPNGIAVDFIGTVDEWQDLSATEKAKYDEDNGVLVNLTNDDMPDDIVGNTNISDIGDGTLTGGLASLKDALTTLSEYSLTSNSKIYRNNKTATIKLTASDSIADLLGVTIPDGYRPTIDANYPVVILNNTNDYCYLGFVTIRTTGVLEFYLIQNYGSTKTQITGGTIWCVNSINITYLVST